MINTREPLHPGSGRAGIAQDRLPARSVSPAIGAMAAIGGIGGGLGVVLAGPIIAALDYHWLFWIPLIPTTVAAVVASFVLDETNTDRAGRLRASAFLLLTTWLVALLLAVSQGSEWGWRSPAMTGLFTLFAVALPLWVRVEWRSPTPLIDMHLMRLRAVWTNNAVTLLVGTCMFGSLVFITDLAETPSTAGYGFGASVAEAGLMIILQPIMSIVVPVVAGRLMLRIGAPTLLTCGSIAIAVSMIFAGLAHNTRWQIALSMGLLGAGVGLVVVSQSHIAVTAVPPKQTGVSAGMNANIRLIGGAIGGALMAAILTAATPAAGPPAEWGYTYAFIAVGILALFGAGIALFIPASMRRQRPGSATVAGSVVHAEAPARPG